MLVLKFGGASVAEPENFLKIADLIIERTQTYKKIVIVVSAMGNTTDRLLQLAYRVNPTPHPRELDMLVSTGERISMALLAMALSAKGVQAVSFTGSQSGIITTECHAEAKIVDVRPKRLLEVLERGQIPIVAGFQGVSRRGEITTLGRGGSDTTAVAVAIALKISEVEFYKDVPGIFEEDPKKNANAKHLPEISYQDALSLAKAGAKVLHPRAIALAEKNQIQLTIRSFQECGETRIGAKNEQNRPLQFETEEG